MTKPVIDYYFWPSSDWSYLGHSRFIKLTKKVGAKVNFKPVDSKKLLSMSGGVPLPMRHINRQNYRKVELVRWKEALASDIVIEPKFFPVDNQAALRILSKASKHQDDVGKLAGEIMASIWVFDKNIADLDVLCAAAERCGIPKAKVQEWVNDKDADFLIAQNTEDAVRAGAFGAPSYIYDGLIFWGQDRLDFLEYRLRNESAGSLA